MAKKGKKSVPTVQKTEKKTVINVNELRIKGTRIEQGFRTGRHLTQKDRPRDKNWRNWE